MKNAVSLLLVFVLCLSLSACGGKSDAPAREKKPVEQDVLANETEPEIVEAEPQFVTVELTLDNWQTYYELAETANFEKNAFDDVERFVGAGVELRLKEEYRQKFVSMNNGAVEYQRQYAVVGCEVNLEAETYKLLDIHKIGEKAYVGTDTLSASCRIGGGEYIEKAPEHEAEIATYAATYGVSGPYAKSVHGYPVNIEITRIQGTLTFSN